MKLQTNMTVTTHSYKHDRSLHRVWKKAIVLEVSHNKLIVGNYRTRVIEANGRCWHTKEPAIAFFYNDMWFNIIAMLKKDGLYFYCNLSSPYLYDGEAIKYIDYDLDIKVFPNGTYIILDEKEFSDNQNKMEYPKDLVEIIEKNKKELIRRIEEKDSPFTLEEINHYYETYKMIKNKS